MTDLLRSGARERPDAPLLHLADGVISYGSVDRAVDALVQANRESGLQRGDRVALRATNDAYTLIGLLALLRGAQTACLISPRLPDDAFHGAVGRCRAAALQHPDADRIDAELARVAGPAPLPPVAWNPDALATLLFTSGSTGTPKIAAHSVANHVRSAQGLRARIPLVPDDRWVLSLPLYHVGGVGIVFRALGAGAQIILPRSPGDLDDALSRFGATHASLVPAQLRRLLGSSVSGLKAILLGGSSVERGLLNEAGAAGLPVRASYGLTEMSSTVTVAAPGDCETSGAVLPHRQVRISEDGEIWVGGETLFAGYFEDGRVQPATDDGWYRTGDLGQIDADGRLSVDGRRDNLFISGGENIQPEAVERALLEIAGIRSAVVVPVPDETYDFRPVAFVEGEAAGSISSALESVLPRFMVPIAYLPMPASAPGMKVNRAALAAHAREVMGQ